MSIDFSNPDYNSETCEYFTLALVTDTVSIFEASSALTDDSTPNFSLFSRLTTSTLTFTLLSSSLNALLLSSGSYSTYYTCNVVRILPSNTVN